MAQLLSVRLVSLRICAPSPAPMKKVMMVPGTKNPGLMRQTSIVLGLDGWCLP